MKIHTTPKFEKQLRRISKAPASLKEKLEFLAFDIKEWPGDKYRSLKWAYQRARYGIDDTMTWSLDVYLAEHISKLLQQYLEQSSGFIVIPKKRKKEIRSMIKAFDEFHKEEWEIEFHDKYRHLLFGKTKDPVKYRRLYNQKYRRLLKRMAKLFDDNYASLWN